MDVVGFLIRSLVMIVVPLAFFWVPAPGLVGFIAGAVCGYLSGSPGRAVVNALVPFAVIAVEIIEVGLYDSEPLLGAAVAGIAFAWLLINDIAMLIGALVGGAVRARTVRSASGQ